MRQASAVSVLLLGRWRMGKLLAVVGVIVIVALFVWGCGYVWAGV